MFSKHHSLCDWRFVCETALHWIGGCLTVANLDVRHGCRGPCYGLKRDWNCSGCLRQLIADEQAAGRSKTIVPVVGNFVHVHNGFNCNVNKTVEKILSFWNDIPSPAIMASQPACHPETTPEKCRGVATGRERVHFELLPHLSKCQDKVRFLDCHRLTDACLFENCAADGGHRNRFVNTTVGGNRTDFTRFGLPFKFVPFS